VKQRYLQIDFLRGIAIILMMIFHLIYDINYFKIIPIYMKDGSYFPYFRNLIVFMFISLVGISLYLSNSNGINIKKSSYRLLKLFVVALVLRLLSYFLYPSRWVYFGIIHLIFVCSFIGIFFVKAPKASLILGLFIIILSYFNLINMHWFYLLTQEPLFLPSQTKDVAHLFPWLGVMFLGIFMGYKKWFLFPLRKNTFTLALSFMGKHALLIYLLHIPILFSIIGFLSKL